MQDFIQIQILSSYINSFLYHLTPCTFIDLEIVLKKGENKISKSLGNCSNKWKPIKRVFLTFNINKFVLLLALQS